MVMNVVLLALAAAAVVASVAALRRIRGLTQRLQAAQAAFADLEGVLRTECLPAVAEGARRAATALDRLDAERAEARADAARAREGLTPLLEEIARATAQLSDARVALAHAIEKAGAPRPVADAERPPDGALLRDLVRAHLIGMGIGSITIDGVVTKPDGTHVARARGMRGAELWAGNVVVRGGNVESAQALAVRMFP